MASVVGFCFFFPFFPVFLRVRGAHTGQARVQRQDSDQSHTAGTGKRHRWDRCAGAAAGARSSVSKGAAPQVNGFDARARPAELGQPPPAPAPFSPISPFLRPNHRGPPGSLPLPRGPHPSFQHHRGSRDSSIRHGRAFPSWKLPFVQQQPPGPQRLSLEWILCSLQAPGMGPFPSFHPGGTHQV